MKARESSQLLDSPLGQFWDVACHAEQSDWSLVAVDRRAVVAADTGNAREAMEQLAVDAERIDGTRRPLIDLQSGDAEFGHEARASSRCNRWLKTCRL